MEDTGLIILCIVLCIGVILFPFFVFVGLVKHAVKKGVIEAYRELKSKGEI